MKLSPKKQKSKKSYPDFKEYKSKFMIASFTIGMALTPAMLTSCNSRPTRNPGTMKVINKDNSKSEAVTHPNSKDEAVTSPKDDKDNKKNDKNIKRPQRTGGVMYRANKDMKAPPCDAVEKADPKDNKNANDSSNIPHKPNTIKGKIRVTPKNK